VSGVRRKVELDVYVAGGCAACDDMLGTLTEVLDDYDVDALVFNIRNVASTPAALLREDRIATTPTLIMRRPLPLRFVGPLHGQSWLRTVLGVVGIARR